MRSNIAFNLYISYSLNMISEDQSTPHRIFRSKPIYALQKIQKKTGGNKMSFHPMGY